MTASIEDCLRVADGLDLVSGATDLDRRVAAVRVWDPARPPDEYAGALVFVVGIGVTVREQPGLASVLDTCAGAGAAGVVLRGRADPGWAEIIGESASMAVLTYPEDLPWDDAYHACREVVAADPRGDVLTVALAAAAAELGASVLLEDRHGRLLGHAAAGGHLDEAGQVSVVTGHAPEALVSWLHASGAGRAVDGAAEPVLVEGGPGCGPRRGLPVWGPHALLGRLWLIGEPPAAAEPDVALMPDHARRLALLLHSDQQSAQRAVRRLDYLLRGLLAGGGTARAVADEWGTAADEPIRLLALSHAFPDAHLPADLAVLVAVLEARLFASASSGRVIRAGDGVYLVARAAELGDEAALTLAEESIRRYSAYAGRNVVAVVSGDSVTLDKLGAVRPEVDRALRLLAATGTSQAMTFDRLAVATFFAGLRELIADRPRMLSGPLEAVLALDAAGRTDYVATLQAYFSANCDLGKAARLLYVHRNTLKYRLERLQELAGLDLDDAAARCAIEVQLRLMHDF